jgi:hypothetical protein
MAHPPSENCPADNGQAHLGTVNRASVRLDRFTAKFGSRSRAGYSGRCFNPSGKNHKRNKPVRNSLAAHALVTHGHSNLDVVPRDAIADVSNRLKTRRTQSVDRF